MNRVLPFVACLLVSWSALVGRPPSASAAVKITAIQSPKGLELFPRLSAVVVPDVRLSLVVSNQVNSITLVWYPSPGTNIVGYRLYYGIASRTYTNVVTLINVPSRTNVITISGASRTNVTVGGIPTNAAIVLSVQGITYFFAATAFDVNGLESDYSNEFSYTEPFSFNTVTLNWTPATTNMIQSSTNLKTWVNVTNTPPPWTRTRDRKTEFFRLKL